MEEVGQKKDEANKLFVNKNYAQAQQKYEEALKMMEKLVQEQEPVDRKLASILHSNIAACLLQSLHTEVNNQNKTQFLNVYESCTNHCNLAINNDSGNIKALYRRAEAHRLAQNTALALRDYSEVLKLDPKNKEAENHARTLVSTSKQAHPHNWLASVEGCAQVLRDPQREKDHEQAITNLVVSSRDEDELARIELAGLIPTLCQYARRATDSSVPLRIRIGALKILNRILHANEKRLSDVAAFLDAPTLAQTITATMSSSIGELSNEEEEIVVNCLALHGALLRRDYALDEKKDHPHIESDIKQYEDDLRRREEEKLREQQEEAQRLREQAEKIKGKKSGKIEQVDENECVQVSKSESSSTKKSEPESLSTKKSEPESLSTKKSESNSEPESSSTKKSEPDKKSESNSEPESLSTKKSEPESLSTKKSESNSEPESLSTKRSEPSLEERTRQLKFIAKVRVLNRTLESAIQIYWLILKSRASSRRLADLTLNEIVKLPWNRSFAEFFSKTYFKEFLVFGCETKDILSIAINKIGSSLPENAYGPIRDSIREFVSEYIHSKDTQNFYRGCVVLASLLLANLDMGIEIFLQEVGTIIDSLDKNAVLEQHKLIISEIISYAAGHKTFQKACKPDVLEELLILLHSDDPEINARMVSATCKLAAGNRELAPIVMQNDGKRQIKLIVSTLNKQSASATAKQWSIEALTFLSLNPRVKEALVQDAHAIDTLMKIAKQEKALRYGVALTFVNLVKYLPKLDETEELKQKINAFANAQKDVPGPDTLDQDEAVTKRCVTMIGRGIVSVFALVVLNEKDKLPGESTCEELTRALLALANNQPTRGRMVADGGVKALLVLFQHNTSEGKKMAAHALARIAISVDPNRFSGTVGAQMIPPIVSLLEPMEENAEHFEAVMALTNLALLGPTECRLIRRDKGLSRIEMLQISNNPHMQRFATQLLANLVQNDDEYFESFKNYTLRENTITLFGAFMGSDDAELRHAACGAVAMLSGDPEICKNIFKKHKVKLPMKTALEYPDDPTLHRIAVIMQNMTRDDDMAKDLLAKQAHLLFINFSLSKFQPLSKIGAEIIEDLKARDLLIDESAPKDQKKNKAKNNQNKNLTNSK